MRTFVEFRHMAATLSLPSTRAQLDAISTALTELQSKEPRKRDRRPIGFIVPDEKKE